MSDLDITAEIRTPGIPVSFEIPDSYDEVESLFGKFSYTDVGSGGGILIDTGWITRHIVELHDLPGYNRTVECHSLVAPILREGLRLATAARPDYRIASLVSFVPRHKLHQRNKPLSLHSWGIAWDINPATNPIGSAAYDMPPEFVEAFESLGALWGGHFKLKPDAMHFQIAYRV